MVDLVNQSCFDLEFGTAAILSDLSDFGTGIIQG